MHYDYTLTVPANTLKTDPAKLTMYLCHGIIHSLDIAFPEGCAAWVHAVIYRFEHQAWPTNPDGDYCWDNYTVEIRNESFGLTSGPYTLSLRCWNEDENFPHDITVRIGIRVPELHRPGSWVGRLLRGEWGE